MGREQTKDVNFVRHWAWKALSLDISEKMEKISCEISILVSEMPFKWREDC